MAAPEIDSAEGINVGGVLIHNGEVDGVDVSAISILRVVVIKVITDGNVLFVGDGITHFTIPVEFNGMDLVSVGAHVYTASTSGTPTFQIHNLTDTVDMLSTRITIDANETDSSTAATPAVIDTGHDDVATGDVIRLDCDVAGLEAKGMEIRMGFE